MTSTRTRIVLASILAVVLLGAASGCARKSATTGAGLEPAKRATSDNSSTATASDSPMAKVSDTSDATSEGTADGTSGSAASNGNTGSTSTPPKTSAPAAKPGMKVLVIFWNDASSKPLKGTEVLLGGTSFKPSTADKRDQGTVGPIAYGDVVQLTVYPDGRTGKKIQVPVTVVKGMVPNSEQDAIHVAVSDGSVRVLGNAISNLDQILPRF